MPRSDAPEQIPLDLPFEERRGAEDFFVSACNEAAYAAIESWPAGWTDPALIIIGPAGAGKSHLAAIWAERARAVRPSLGAIGLNDVPRLAAEPALLMEDVDRNGLDDAVLFHLINAVRDRGGSLLLTARSEPSTWPIAAPDLLSRLRRAPCVTIAPPDDGLLRALLVKLFMDRQLTVDTRVIETIILRAERSFAAARAIVDALDQAALAAGRRITRAMAQDVIANLSDPHEVER